VDISISSLTLNKNVSHWIPPSEHLDALLNQKVSLD